MEVLHIQGCAGEKAGSRTDCSKSQVWLLLSVTSESVLGPGGLERANPFPQGKGDGRVEPREVLL